MIEVQTWLGVDRNIMGHIAVVANTQTGKEIRRKLQKAKKYRLLKKIKNREDRVIRDLNHKVSRKIVEIAREQNAEIKLEKLGGISNDKKHTKSFNYSLHSWLFYQLKKFIEYKARLNCILITYVESKNTWKECSRCGGVGI